MKKGKANRRWDNAATGEEAAALDYSGGASITSSVPKSNTNSMAEGLKLSASEAANLTKLRGTLQEGFDELQVSSDEENGEFSEDEECGSDIKCDKRSAASVRSYHLPQQLWFMLGHVFVCQGVGLSMRKTNNALHAGLGY